MAQSNLVFLIDVNGIPREPATGGLETDKQDVKIKPDPDQSLELFPFKDDDDFGKLPGSDVLEWLKEFVLVTLLKEANNGKEYDFSRVQWSFKFFDSSHHADYRDGRTFLPLDNESFTNFESQLQQHMKGGSGGGASSLDMYAQYDSSRVKYLSDAIKAITSLAWIEGSQLNFSRTFNGDQQPITKNSVYALLRVPRTEKQLRDFADLQANSSTKDFMGVLLPSAFSSTFHHKLRIQLNFVDMWAAPENANHCFDPDWNGSYPRQIVKCLQYLGNGKIVAMPSADYGRLSSSCMSLGLIPYITFLRSRLQQASAQNENIPSHIQKLVPVANKHLQKISPDFDSASVSRSLKSGSVLEASMNSQNKILRPFRISSGHYEDDNSATDSFQLKLRERLREGDRKRKRVEYDSDDLYARHDRHHYSGFDDAESESVEVDSQCERVQRLENWVNDGVFTNVQGAKRKKHLETVPAVPMSRPALSKSFHVFHEPAPKLVTSRSKKMLAHVERRIIKETAHVESRRRSSGEGLLDIKRITQKQERELSAIKRRLKAYLEGELEDAEPITWMKTLQKMLRTFADMILQEEEPCLVALAQALVNCASVKFTPQKVNAIREFYRKDSVTTKVLLEQLLLVEFTTLNRRIIDAQDPKKEKAAKDPESIHLHRRTTFRETELQIILRLEIAWCFFIEPDEDAMEDVLMEIVRLLQIIQAYRIDPPTEYFVNTVLLPTYSQSTKFMRALYKKMNIPLPAQLAMDGSPVPSSSRRDDDSSMISSTSSANLYPEDSASQLNVQKRHRPSPTAKSNRFVASHTSKKPISGSKKLKRHIMVATSNPKLSSSHFMVGRSDPQKKANTGAKISPKRVRRNLFDVPKNDKKDSKTLIALSSSASRLTKSPAFKSPKGKSPISPSGFFRAARSRRQLVLSQPNQFGSPVTNAEVLCPESPATPGGALSVASKYAPTSTSTGSIERPRVIQESPEIQKHDFDDRPIGRVASLSFYSTGSNAPKSRAWEKSETQLMAARIKESVDVRSKELSISDFESFPLSPDAKPKPTRVSESTGTPRTSLSFCDDSYIEKTGSPLPSTSTLSTQLIQHLTGPAPNLDNPNIQALITSNSIFPILSSKDDVPLAVAQTEPRSPIVAAATGSPSNLQTPSKRVQFNLTENLVNTPSSARHTSSGTPKSILKETHDT